MAATYDISTDRGKARLHAADTNIQDPIFEDEEYDYFLELTGDSPLLAAAMALEAMSTDAAKLAVILKNDNQSTDPTKLPGILSERAAILRAQATANAAGDFTLVAERVQVFQPEENTATPGNLDPW